MKKIISQDFRDYCFNKFPAIQENISYRYFFNYLCFATFKDEDTKRLIINTRVLCGCEKKEYDPHHYTGHVFLNNFKKDVLPNFTWKESDFNQLKPRMVIDQGFNQELKDLIQKEINDFNKENKIYFTTGEKYTPFNRTKYIKEELIQIKKENIFKYNDSQKIVLDYLNNLQSKAFSQKLISNNNLILNAIEMLDTQKEKDHQCKVIHSIIENPIVRYSHSEYNRTCRLFAIDTTVLSLISSVRKAFCSGWTDLDLKASQFCILAELLDATVSKAFIKSGENLWKYFNFISSGKNEIPSKDIKTIYKKIVYGIAFGLGKIKLKNFAKNNNIEKILECDIIKELLIKRKEWYKQINKDGYVTDVWNNKLYIEKPSIDNPKGRWAGALAASKIQSIEFEIIKSLFDFANEHQDNFEFKIMLMQHDGVTVSFYSKVKKDLAINNMKKIIFDKGKQMGYLMLLEVEDL